jgi:hypothetical protein
MQLVKSAMKREKMKLCKDMISEEASTREISKDTRVVPNRS